MHLLINSVPATTKGCEFNYCTWWGALNIMLCYEDLSVKELGRPSSVGTLATSANQTDDLDRYDRYMVKSDVNHQNIIKTYFKQSMVVPSWSWSYGSWIYNYLCNQYLSPLAFWVRTLLRWGVLDTTLCEIYQWFVAGQWFSSGTPVSSSNKTDHHDITEILLKVALNTITPNILKQSIHIQWHS